MVLIDWCTSNNVENREPTFQLQVQRYFVVIVLECLRRYRMMRINERSVQVMIDIELRREER